MSDYQWCFENPKKAADLIEQLQQQIAELEAKTSCCMGVGNGNGRLFVYGNHESIKAAQRYILEREELAVTVNRLRDYIERGSPYSTNPSKCERKAILAATPKQNLAEHDVEVLLKLADYIEEGFGMPITMGCDEVREYAKRIKDGQQ